MPVTDFGALALRLRTALDRSEQIQPLTSDYPNLTITAGYEIAHLVHTSRLCDGAVAAGRKIGFTNPDMWALYGVRAPIWGHMYDTTVVRVVDGHASCSLGRFVEPKIEPEIVFHFGSTPSLDADLPALLECVDWIAHGFEIVQSHFPGWKFGAADAVADNSLHGMFLLGEPQAVGALGSDVMDRLKQFSLALTCDGILREVGRGSNVLGSPLAALGHLAAVLRQQPEHQSLQAGELVTTGTITSALSVRAGELWQTELEGIALPGLAVRFTP